MPTVTLIDPASPAVELPVNTSTSPVALAPPFTVLPDPMCSVPLPPEPVVPLLNTIVPLTPAEIALADRIVTAPDDDTGPPPLTTLTTPPTLLLSVVSPACRARSPPLPESPTPTVTLMDPPALPTASPDP